MVIQKQDEKSSASPNGSGSSKSVRESNSHNANETSFRACGHFKVISQEAREGTVDATRILTVLGHMNYSLERVETVGLPPG